MGGIYVIPQWFFSYDIVLNLIFGIITGVVSVASYKIYKLSLQRQSKLFSLAFLSISVSYLLQAFLIFVLFSKLSLQSTISFFSFTFWLNLTLYAHILFFLVGITTLAYMILGVRSMRVYILLSLITLAPFLITESKLYLFHLLSAVLLIYVLCHYILHFWEKKNKRNLFIMLAFGLFLLSQFFFMFSIKEGFYYIVGDVVSILAYLIMIVNLVTIRRT
ncbi:hypothetical protein HZB00_00120 [Candidatus Woesearchaeota archaeon]|nr:hypothetical protein [Candidatus Woesearchaeota archaeon]